MKLEIVNPHVTVLARVGDQDLQRDWHPGDLCYLWNKRSVTGTVIAVQNDENLLVLWSVIPHRSEIEKVHHQMACQIQAEFDAEIIRDLLAMGEDK